MGIYEKLDDLLSQQNKTIFTAAEIIDLYVKHHPNPTAKDQRSSVIPSDYCYNRINKGITGDKNIFIYIGANTYEYVGKNYPYNGDVYHKEKGAKYAKIVGECKNGKYTAYQSPINLFVELEEAPKQKDTVKRKDIPKEEYAPQVKDEDYVIYKGKIKEFYKKYLEIFELETRDIGFKPTALGHLNGRIGEYKCALETNGRLARKTNQRGFDVISGTGKRISVKTTAQTDKNPFVSIAPSTLNEVDELMVIRFVSGEFKIICYIPMSEEIAEKEDIRKYIDKKTHKEQYELDISKAEELQKKLGIKTQ